MMVDGRAIAEEISALAAVRARQLPRPPLVVAIVGSETPATLSYLKIKKQRAEAAGCRFETRPLGSAFGDADAAIIQLPLPPGMDQKTLCDSLPLGKDADVLSSVAREKFVEGKRGALLPPVVGAIQEIFERAGVDPRGKHAVVIGKGWLVGNPAALWLGSQGARVTIIASHTDDLAMHLKEADIIVSGAGSPHLIKPGMLKPGVVLIDAGTSESGGTLAGDADPACADIASVFTPVPGGVGPIAVACLFENAVTLAERAMNP